MKLFFVRHGRTIWNLEGRFQGAGGTHLFFLSLLTPLKAPRSISQQYPFSMRFIQVIYQERSNLQNYPKSTPDTMSFKGYSDLREWHLGKLEGLKIATLNLSTQQIKAFRSNLASLIRGCLKQSPFTVLPRDHSVYQI